MDGTLGSTVVTLGLQLLFLHREYASEREMKEKGGEKSVSEKEKAFEGMNGQSEY